MTRQSLFAAFFFAVFLFLLYQFYRMFQGFLAPLAWAALLAVLFYPLQQRLTRVLRGREGAAAFLLTTAVIAVVILPTIGILILVANESALLYQRSVEFVAGGGPEQILERLRASHLGRLWNWGAPFADQWNIDLGGLGVKGVNIVSSFLVAQATGVAKNLLGFVIDFFLCTIALFFFFRDGERMVSGVRGLLPMEAEHKDLVLTRVYEALSAVVQGTLMTAIAQGTLAGLGYWVLGVPFAVFLGCGTAFISLIPMGTPLAWGSVAIYLLVIGSIGKAVALVLWGTLGIGTIDNVIRPLVIGGRTDIPTIFLFFGILGGLQAYGFLGMFLAPAVIAMLVAFVRIYREQYVMLPGLPPPAEPPAE